MTAVQIGIGVRVIDATCRPASGNTSQWRRFVGIDRAVALDRIERDLDAFRLALADVGKRAAATLAKRDDDAALAGLVFGKATVDTIFITVLRADIAAEIGAVDFNVGVRRLGLDFRRQGFPDLVGQDECRLVLAAQIARQLQSRDALGAR